jgi:hypothetical protein
MMNTKSIFTRALLLQQTRRFGSAPFNMVESNKYLNQLLSDPVYHNKCVGVARNFFTGAMKANAANPEFEKTLP